MCLCVFIADLISSKGDCVAMGNSLNIISPLCFVKHMFVCKLKCAPSEWGIALNLYFGTVCFACSMLLRRQNIWLFYWSREQTAVLKGLVKWILRNISHCFWALVAQLPLTTESTGSYLIFTQNRRFLYNVSVNKNASGLHLQVPC